LIASFPTSFHEILNPSSTSTHHINFFMTVANPHDKPTLHLFQALPCHLITHPPFPSLFRHDFPKINKNRQQMTVFNIFSEKRISICCQTQSAVMRSKKLQPIIICSTFFVFMENLLRAFGN
jgi:hypothetical protein